MNKPSPLTFIRFGIVMQNCNSSVEPMPTDMVRVIKLRERVERQGQFE